MNSRRWTLAVIASVLSWACGEPAAAPGGPLAPSFAKGGVGRPSVLVNPNADDNGTAKTIQEGIDMVAEGGKVMVLPGTYNEAIVIDKGLTLEGIADGSGPVVIEQVMSSPPPRGGQEAVIRVTTSEPVVIRTISVHHVNVRGLNGFAADRSAAVDLTIKEVTFEGRFQFGPPVFNNGVSVVNNATQSGARARLVITDSRIDASGIGISIGGDVDALIEGNTLGGADHSACVFVSPTGQGVTVPAGAETNVDILDNSFTECGALRPGRASYFIGVFGAAGATTRGTVNIVGNAIHNTIRAAGDCNTAGIVYEHYSGRIEHNTISGLVQGCATPDARVVPIPPAAVFVGSLRGFGPGHPVVRFNDITGNAFASLRIGPNQTAIDASCNYWGSADGPSGTGPGSGDAIVVEPGGATPTFMPFATAPIAGSGATSC